jgi:Uma2 family endonuclease
MATDVEVEQDEGEAVVLEGISWKLYCALRESEGNDHIRMTYLDGTLILMSPEYVHDRGATDLGILVIEFAQAQGLEVEPTRTTTLRRKGRTKRKGSGKEPDEGFYIGDNAEKMREKDTIDLTVDPPPDLAIEIGNTGDSRVALSTYVRLLVPEVWRYSPRRRELWFGVLAGGEYEPIGRSVAFPMLTRGIVVAALDARITGKMGFIAWKIWLAEWARSLPKWPETP